MNCHRKWWYDPDGHPWVSKDAYEGRNKMVKMLKEKKNMENEWTILKENKIPEDYLTGDYEFEGNFNGDWEFRQNNIKSRIHYLENISESKRYGYRYRKPAPKQPTHEEIVSKWWYIPEAQSWGKVVGYKRGRYAIAVVSDGIFEGIDIIKRNSDAFMFYRSSDMPEEVE